MPALIAPTTRLHTAWLEAHDEWGPGRHEDGFGLRPADEVDSPTGFAAWVARLADESGQVTDGADRARCTYRWIVEDDRVLGGIALRHGFDDFVRWAGHIGYGIRPSARRRGLATWALGRMLDEAGKLGIDRVLIVCAADNIASAKTIERQGGVLERILDTELGPARRYWIDTAARVAADGQRPDHHGQPVVSPAGEHVVDAAAGDDR
ncbi:GNAT family N-acetyltransferase [Nocardia abscessus]|uniref:GNAT family N-acetyltransferase n=1 Tax=Nocardia abscessus TaxID=120957 RepID=UPI00031F82BB|nr:GNAT family N-acetyltransferase [Nocardia abscessus]MCC3326108.1 GNAT family N-acetyltransferase [Nocardia abscessus]